jgi:organic radical activating enzyme
VSNIVLTHNCNKKCSYCFAAHTRANDEMTLEKLEEILNIKGNDEIVQLLGGEPTLHSKFKQVLELCAKKTKHITLISNFLFSENILNTLVDFVNTGYDISFLVNSTDLDVNNRMDIFKKNFNTLYELLYIRKSFSISNSITIDEAKSKEYYMNYIDFLINNLVNITWLRLSVRFPSEFEKGDFYIINNKELGNLIMAIVKKAAYNDITAGLDCIKFPCMFESRLDLNYIDNFLHGSNKGTCHDGGSCGALDFSTDGTLYHCYPCSRIKVIGTDYGNMLEAGSDIKRLYNQAMRKVSKPETCLKCQWYKNGECDGPCLGFYKVEDYCNA